MRAINYLLLAVLLLGGCGKLEIKWVDKEETKTAEEKTTIDYNNLSVEELLALAEKGYAQAQYSLGVRYKYGEGVPKNSQEALKWIKKSAEQGYAEAQGQ